MMGNYFCVSHKNRQKTTNILKELRNRILRIIRMWSLFTSKRVYTSLHFSPVLLEN